MSARERSVIINADDFGLSPAVSRGIARAFRDGVLTSSTMLANLEHFDDGVAVAREHPDLPLGVHLTLLWGAPVSPPDAVPALVDGSGRFPESASVLLRRWMLGRLPRAQIRAEFRSQVRRFVDAGLSPTHFDTHKHIHCLPPVFGAMMDVAREFDVPRLRVPLERRLPGSGDPPGVTSGGRRKRRWLAWACRGHRRRLARHGLRTTDAFLGLAWGDRLNVETFRFIFERVPVGVTEVMCHAGEVDADARRFGTGSIDREYELAALLDPRTRAAANAAGVRLVSWREV